MIIITRARFFLSHDIKNTKKSHLLRENVEVLPSLTQRYNGRYNVTLQNV